MLPIVERLPRLAQTLPHVDLGVRETPVERWNVDGVSLLIRRDDLSAPSLGGNKVRALEFLLAGVRRGDDVLTVGPSGSTHAMSVAQYASQVGAHAHVFTWPQKMHPVAHATAERLAALAHVMPVRSPTHAYARVGVRRLRAKVRWIPAGGSTPLGALGHVNAALELVAQCARENQPLPRNVVVPLGSGGTAAGLIAGFALAGVSVPVVGVRVVPRVVGNRWHVLHLAGRTRALLERLSGERLPKIQGSALEIVEDAIGDGYGHETAVASRAAELLRAAGGPPLEATYSAKAFGAALALARRTGDGSVMFWLTFDARWLGAESTVARSRPTL